MYETVQGCRFNKEEEEQMTDLLYYATIYYEVRKYIQELERDALIYEVILEKAKSHEKMPGLE